MSGAIDPSFLTEPRTKTWRIVAARRATTSGMLVLVDDQGVEHTWHVPSLERHGMHSARDIGPETVKFSTPWILTFSGQQGYLESVKLEQVPY